MKSLGWSTVSDDRHSYSNQSTYLPEGHVLFDGVDARLEGRSGCVHVGDHRTDVTDDGGKDQHTHLEENREQSLYKTDIMGTKDLVDH